MAIAFAVNMISQSFRSSIRTINGPKIEENSGLQYVLLIRYADPGSKPVLPFIDRTSPFPLGRHDFHCITIKAK